MGKNRFLKLIYIFLLVGLLFGLLTACSKIKTVLDNEDYVEVTGLRIDKASIYMSPSGDASTYQLQVEILPANASNRKLNYYIASEYLDYVSVDNKGLITARRAPDEGVSVPLIITSTTNGNAKLTVNIVIEEIAVRSIRFKQEKVALLFEGEGATASIEYYPTHAVDGRLVEFSSLNEKVATVQKDENGNALITPVGAGQTHIKAVSTTSSQVTSEAFLLVTVDYLQAQYKLRVTGSPQWTQVIGNFTDINFTLDILGEHIDPNPEIEWYVGSERVLGLSDSIQYTHRPTATTMIEYKIGVCIRAYRQEAEWLYSDEISVYNDFKGFDLEYQNLSSAYTAYQYGDEATFKLLDSSSGSVASYDWFLQKMDGDNNLFQVGTTPVESRNLTKRINVVGDYQLWAYAKSEDGTLLKPTLFTFSSERLTVGDVLSVSPQMIEGGLPPDSYHWYYVPCDEDGNFDIRNKVDISSTSQNEILYLPLRTAGYFRLYATATSNGVLTTVLKDGERVEYSYIGMPIRVYAAGTVLETEEGDLVDFSEPSSHAFAVSKVSRISDVVIEGSVYMNQTLLYVHWAPTSGVPRFEAELLFEDGSVVILDSAEPVAVFGPNYLYIPSDVATFSDKFSIRVKQKDGLFSDYYYYGIPNAKGGADKTHVLNFGEETFEYFSDLTTNVNRYVTTMDEMAALVEYILLNQPTKNSFVQKGNVTKKVGDVDVLYDTFTVRFLTILEYTSEMINAFSIDTDDVPNEYIDIYTMICGANQQGPFLSDFSLSVETNDKGEIVATFMLPNGNKTAALRASPSTDRNDDVSSVFRSAEPYEEISITYPIDRKEGVYVGTSDELLYVMEQGYRPVPTGSDDLANLYKQIKSVYSSLIGPEMSDIEKALAFYDWLCYSVAYDRETDMLASTQSALENYMYESHRLEGIFAVKNINNRHAVVDGFAKAFSALCGLAGIPCRTVAAKVGSRHVYSKVYLMDAWYVVDVSYGIAEVNDVIYADHSCFLMSDAEYSAYCLQLGYRVETYGIHPVANKKYDFFMEAKASGASLYVTSDEELEALLEKAVFEGTVAVEIECGLLFCNSLAALTEKTERLILSTGKYVANVIATGESENVQALLILEDNQ